jgi:hypothetical protein
MMRLLMRDAGLMLAVTALAVAPGLVVGLMLLPSALATWLLLGWDEDAGEMPASGAFVGDEPLRVQPSGSNANDLAHFAVALRAGRRMGERGT